MRHEPVQGWGRKSAPRAVFVTRSEPFMQVGRVLPASGAQLSYWLRSAGRRCRRIPQTATVTTTTAAIPTARPVPTRLSIAA